MAGVVVPVPTPIYHITHVNNLPLIMADRGLRCNADLRRGRVAYSDIAYGNIQDRRARTAVTCGPRGLLHDYVPFYFGPRSPMLLTISSGLKVWARLVTFSSVRRLRGNSLKAQSTSRAV